MFVSLLSFNSLKNYFIADDGSDENATWHLVKFSFRIKIGDTEIMFKDVTGFSAATQVIGYLAGNSK